MSRHEDPTPSKEDIDAIFSKYCVEEYIPEGANTQKNQPKYTPTPLNAGPKPLTIEEYLERNQKKKKRRTETRNEEENEKGRKETPNKETKKRISATNRFVTRTKKKKTIHRATKIKWAIKNPNL